MLKDPDSFLEKKVNIHQPLFFGSALVFGAALLGLAEVDGFGIGKWSGRELVGVAVSLAASVGRFGAEKNGARTGFLKVVDQKTAKKTQYFPLMSTFSR